MGLIVTFVTNIGVILWINAFLTNLPGMLCLSSHCLCESILFRLRTLALMTVTYCTCVSYRPACTHSTCRLAWLLVSLEQSWRYSELLWFRHHYNNHYKAAVYVTFTEAWPARLGAMLLAYICILVLCNSFISGSHIYYHYINHTNCSHREVC